MISAQLVDLAASIVAQHPVVSRFRTPPIDLHRLASELGVSEVVEKELMEDGRLEKAPTSATIAINARAGRLRKRFTLAHEIGHVLLENSNDSVVRQRTESRSREERLCDEIASEILMPRSDMSARFAAARSNLPTAHAVADTYQVSLAAAVIRLHETLDWEKCLLTWMWAKEGWQVVGRAAVPSWLEKGLQSSNETGRFLHGLASADSVGQLMEIPIRLWTTKAVLLAETSSRGRSIQALADRRKPCRRAAA